MILKRIKTFLTAEEIPRWFGLSVVLIYLVGLGAVAQSGIVGARREATDYYTRSSLYAVQALLDRLSTTHEANEDEQAFQIACRLALRNFASHIPVHSLHVLDPDKRVIASINEAEVGTMVGAFDVASVPEHGLAMSHPSLTDARGADRVYRARIHGPGSTPATSLDPTGVAQAVVSGLAPASEGTSENDRASFFFLEARLPPDLGAGSTVADNAGMLTILLVVFGALFFVVRCLREQLRGMSRIASRLRTHRDRIEKDLASLTITDTLDAATEAWNELVGVAQTSFEAVQRSQANVELSRVLERSGGGALSEALNAIPDGVIYITDEVRFEYLNSTACRILDWDPKETRGKTLPEAQSSGIGAKVLGILHEALQGDGSYTPRTEVLQSGPMGNDGAADGPAERADDDQSTYRVWVIPLHRAHHHGECMVVVRDVSQQTRAERAREEFVTQVTHELRTPLTNIRAYAETLSSGMFDDPKVVTECYNVITKETRRLSRLIEDILSISQLEVGSIELDIDNVDVKTLLSEGVRDIRGLADEKNIDVQLLLPSKLEPIRGDRDKLAVVINNLLGNAIKYTPPDGNVVVGCQIKSDEVLITFKDNGVGIAPADHTKVFEKFQRADDPEIQKETGSGIGLYTAREIVRRHGGEIELISRKGEGSTFMVRLPHRESRATSLSTTQVS